ncbi:molecular chaperone DnaJ [Bacteroides fragilis]|nr:molecular chaperone DnaJ [Bacteroides fragilis]MCE8655301.1 molecular chaperone DnaJ [Bacteroides fragilis]
MSTCKWSSEEFVNLENSSKGVILVYTDTKGKKSAQYFFGEGYVPANKTQDAVFKVWRNVVATFWNVKHVELGLRKDNDGIRTKLRASTPSEIIFRAENGDVKRFQLEFSVWSKVGLIPTKKDLERLSKARDLKDAIHRAAKASFDALGFRVQLAKEETAPVSITQPVVQEVPVAEVNSIEQIVEQSTEEVVEQAAEQVAELVAEQSVEQPVVQEAVAPVTVPVEQVAEQTAMQSPEKPKNKRERKRRQRIGEVKNAA